MVIEVSDATFAAQLAATPDAVVKFHAGWCGSCKLFAPKFKRLSTDERFEGFTFLSIDAEHNPETRALVNAKSLPFFAVFKDGKLVKADSTAKEEFLVNMILAEEEPVN